MYSEKDGFPSALIDLKDFEKYKRMTVQTAKLLQEDSFLSDRGKLIEHCGDCLSFDEEHNLCSASFCRQRLCPNCQRRKALRTYAKFKAIAEELEREGYAFVHLVLTIQNCEGEELSETISRMYDASSRLFKSRECKRVFKGVLRCLEVSYSKRECNFHPHLHCLIAVKKSYFTSRYYLKIAKIRELWQFFLKTDYIPQCWATKCNEGAIAEVAKYAVKPLELDLCNSVRLAVLQKLFGALHGRRLLQTYGVIRATAQKLNIDLNDEEESDGTEPRTEAKFSFVYNFTKRKYEPRDLGEF